MVTSIGTIPGSVPDLTGSDFIKCVPVDISRCMSSVMNLMQNPPSLVLRLRAGRRGRYGRRLGGRLDLGVPGLSGLDLDGCNPIDLEACLSSLLSMAGNLPAVGNLDLSAAARRAGGHHPRSREPRRLRSEVAPPSSSQEDQRGLE